MAWFKVDDGLWCHPKMVGLSAHAVALWLKAGSWAAQQLTDGQIPAAALPMFGATTDAAQELVTAGLWTSSGPDYVFHDWLDYQPSATETEALRLARSQAGRKGGLSKAASKRLASAKANGVANGVANDLANGKQNSAPSPSPSPSPEDLTTNVVMSSRETHLPKTWAPTAEHITRAKRDGLDVIIQAEKFRAHAAEKGRTAKNWNGAFTRWLINAKEYADRDAQRASPQQRRATTDERVAGWLALGDQMTMPQGEPDWKELTA